MRTLLLTLMALALMAPVLAACSIVLDDPAPFVVDQDATPADAGAPDAEPDAEMSSAQTLPERACEESAGRC